MKHQYNKDNQLLLIKVNIRNWTKITKTFEFQDSMPVLENTYGISFMRSAFICIDIEIQQVRQSQRSINMP